MREEKVFLKIINSFLRDEPYQPEIEFDENKLYDIAHHNKMSCFLYDWSLKYCKSEEIKQKISEDFRSTNYKRYKREY